MSVIENVSARVGDNRRGCHMTSAAPRLIRGAAAQPVSTRSLIEWAFAREKAQLEFEDDVMRASGYGYVSSTAAIIQHEQLGCRIDGGGRSDPHPDADVVAAAVAALPEARGGHRMAVWVAELARAGRVPDCMVDARPVVRPVETHVNRWGEMAKTADAAALGSLGWPAQARRNRKGVVVQDAVLFCPVRITPTVDQIASARRAYLDWRGALMDLRDSFTAYGGLTAWRVTDELPPLRPWIRNTCITKLDIPLIESRNGG